LLSQETPEICICGNNFKEAFKDKSFSEILSLVVTPTSEKKQILNIIIHIIKSLL